MPEETPQAIQVPVNETQDSPMPSEPQKTAEPTQSVEPVLPDGSSERTTREFDKLRTQLREERAARQYYETVFTQLQPKQQQQPTTPIVDPDTGYVNEQALTAAQQAAYEAKQEAQMTRQQWNQYLQDQEDRETYAAHPDLNPKDTKTFNREKHVGTRQIMLDSMLNPGDYGGRQLSFKEAADLAANRTSSVNAEEARREGAKEALEQLTPKEQASLGADGFSSERVGSYESSEELAVRTRKGDVQSIIARMRKTQG